MVAAERRPLETDLYHRAILDAAEAAAGRGALKQADASVELDNPLCGDRVRIEVAMDGERLRQVAHEVRGCLLCEAAASVIGSRAPGERGRDLEDMVAGLRRALDGEWEPPRWPALEMFRPVRGYRSRHDCVLLPFDALVRALERARQVPG